jgi:DNA polymerase-3 subunit alpha
MESDPALAGLPTAVRRPRLLAAVDAACEHGARLQRDANEGQAQLFGAVGGGDEHVTVVPALPDVPAWTETEQLAYEKETLGLYWSGHPVDRYAGELKDYGTRTTLELAEAQPTPAREDSWGPGGRKPIEPDTSIGGIVAACRQLKTRKGDRMAVFTLEDAVGGVEVVVFPEAYQRAATLIETGTLVLVRGKLERDDESVRILASEIAPLDSVRERVAHEVAIRMTMPADRGVFQALGEIFSRHRGDRRVSFEFELPAQARRLRVKADLSSQIRVRPSPSLVAEVEQLVGQGSVSLR